ncbi:hypothetical protein SNEBB_008240 [Seison nebaliae]|nr:hypothetical protein SNEBB_008240 [Seison nebaliae]
MDFEKNIGSSQYSLKKVLNDFINNYNAVSYSINAMDDRYDLFELKLHFSNRIDAENFVHNDKMHQVQKMPGTTYNRLNVPVDQLASENPIPIELVTFVDPECVAHARVINTGKRLQILLEVRRSNSNEMTRIEEQPITPITTDKVSIDEIPIEMTRKFWCNITSKIYFLIGLEHYFPKHHGLCDDFFLAHAVNEYYFFGRTYAQNVRLRILEKEMATFDETQSNNKISLKAGDLRVVQYAFKLVRVYVVENEPKLFLIDYGNFIDSKEVQSFRDTTPKIWFTAPLMFAFRSKNENFKMVTNSQSDTIKFQITHTELKRQEQNQFYSIIEFNVTNNIYK